VSVSKANWPRGWQNQKDGSLLFCLGFDIAGADAEELQIARKEEGACCGGDDSYKLPGWRSSVL